jgi:hypothetical protein
MKKKLTLFVAVLLTAFAPLVLAQQENDPLLPAPTNPYLADPAPPPDIAPSNTLPSDTLPTSAAPSDTLFTDTLPTDTAPSDTPTSDTPTSDTPTSDTPTNDVAPSEPSPPSETNPPIEPRPPSEPATTSDPAITSDPVSTSDPATTTTATAGPAVGCQELYQDPTTYCLVDKDGQITLPDGTKARVVVDPSGTVSKVNQDGTISRIGTGASFMVDENDNSTNGADLGVPPVGDHPDEPALITHRESTP